MDIAAIRQLVELVRASGISGLEYREGDVSIVVKNSPLCVPAEAQTDAFLQMPQPARAVSAFPAAPAPAAEPAAAPADTPAAPAPEKNAIFVTSPMVGVFRSLESLGKQSPAPGERVTADTVVCAVEAMKMVCEIKAEKEGALAEFLLKNGDQVEFGQPLLRLAEG